MDIDQTKYDSSNETKFIILMNPEALGRGFVCY